MTAALILVDVIKNFFDPKGSNYYPVYPPILDNIKKVLEKARGHGLVIIHAMEGHRPGHDKDFERQKLPEHSVLNTRDAEPAAGIDILEGEHVVRKRRYSAFMATDLDLLLRELEVDRIFLVGVKSHVCIRATAQDAFGLGYKVYVVNEAVGSNYKDLHKASLEDIERYMGELISLDESVSLFEEYKPGDDSSMENTNER
ncbi:MAG: isochorismatase family cysteine hydrolase [Anaerolineales bacterium]